MARSRRPYARWHVTFERITPHPYDEEYWEARGFVGRRFTLREALRTIGGCEGGVEASEFPVSCPRWITFYKQSYNYRTGAETSMSLHFPEHVTPASRRRICRLVGCYGA